MMRDRFRRARPDWHIADDDLLLYADGELSPAQSVRVHEHLESCWPCRVRAEKYSHVISQLVDCVSKDLAGSIPPPPNTWRYFAGSLHAASLQRRSLLANLKISPRFISRYTLQWSATAALILILGFLLSYVYTRPAPRPAPASAGELLRRATSADERRLQQVRQPVVYQVLAIRTAKGSLTREIWRDASRHRSKEKWPQSTNATETSGVNASSTTPSEVEELKETFAANNFSWEDPLSAQSYESWRAKTVMRSEQVKDEGDRITLTTLVLNPLRSPNESRAGHVTLVGARLTIRVPDLHPISEILDFSSYADGKESIERIELAELKYDVIPFSSLRADVFDDAEPPTLGLPSSRSAGLHGANRASLAELADSEMAARFALHESGADLNSPITVLKGAHEGDVVTIRGIVDSPAKQQQILRMLAGIPFVRADLKTEADLSQGIPGPAPTSAIKQTPASVPPPRSPIANQLMRDLQSQEAVEALSEQAFSSAESLMAHAWAWRRLSERYSEIKDGGPELRPSSQQLIDTMLRDYREGMRTDATTLLKTLEPVLISFSAAAIPASDRTPLFERTSRVEALTLYLLFGSPPKERQPASAEEAARDLLGQLRLLTSELEKQP